jgi:hypothetical protein
MWADALDQQILRLEAYEGLEPSPAEDGTQRPTYTQYHPPTNLQTEQAIQARRDLIALAAAEADPGTWG